MGAEGAENDLHYSGAQLVQRLKPAWERISGRAIRTERKNYRLRLIGSQAAGIGLYGKCDADIFCVAAAGWPAPPGPGTGFPDRVLHEPPSDES
jgi:hypothetical protein